MPIKKRYITLIFAFFFMLFPTLVDAKSVYLGGESVGIEIINEGLIISGTYDVKEKRNIYNPSADSDIKKGDILVGGYFLGSDDKVFETQALSRATLLVNETYTFSDSILTEENQEIYKNICLFYSEKECVDYKIEQVGKDIKVELKLRVYLFGG